MKLADKDLISIQEVRNLLAEAKSAQRKLAQMSQSEIDNIVAAVSRAGMENAAYLAKLACEETGFGKVSDKTIKNKFAAGTLYEAIKDEKTVGIIGFDKEKKVMDIAVGVGVIAGLVPSTNPTSTVIYKTMIALKSANAICFSPHPGAKKCILEAVRLMAEAAEREGCPKGAVSAVSVPTMEATKELMSHKYTSLILATGGAAMVKAAYSSGTPAIGVGAGNGPAFIDKSADVRLAVRRIVASKSFDYGTICASEQSIVVTEAMKETVLRELRAEGAYILNEEESKKLAKFILRPNYTMNPQIVGKSVETLCGLAGIYGVPKDASVLVAAENAVGMEAVYSHEKLAPILAFFVEKDEDACLRRCIEILNFEGAGHTFAIHSENEAQVKKFAMAVPASRILVNTSASLGGVGATTNLFPALTLGCGSAGGSSSSNNIGPNDLINIKRAAWGIRELEEIRQASAENTAFDMSMPNGRAREGYGGTDSLSGQSACIPMADRAMIERIVEKVLNAVAN